MKEITLEDMLKAGVHFGHKTSRWHPKMRPYIFTVKKGVHVIDLEKSLEMLKKAQEFAKKITSNNGVVLFIGTRKQFGSLVKDSAKRCEMPFVADRWLGGTFTNFNTVSKQALKLEEMKRSQETGGFNKYTKKEQVMLSKRIKRLEKLFGGISGMKKLPDAVFVVDPRDNVIAISEALNKKIKIIAVADTNVNPSKIDFPIPSNDDAMKAVELVVNAIADAVLEGRKSSEAEKPVQTNKQFVIKS